METALKSFLKFILLIILLSQFNSSFMCAQTSLPETNLQKPEKEQSRYNYSPDDVNSSIKKVIEKSAQILIVTSKEWESPVAGMVYYERRNDKMIKMADTIQVNLGRSGLGWGDGLTEFNKSAGPVKREGDGRSPAGIFSLSYAFGYLPKDSLIWLDYPYEQVTAGTECVDDTASEYYNRILDADSIVKTWKSSEIMRGYGPYYKYGIFVDHNSNPPVPGCGSCIFIHVWGGYGKPTSGCTAMAEDQIVKLLHWLSAEKKPILIQLTENEFNKIRPVLGL